MNVKDAPRIDLPTAVQPIDKTAWYSYVLLGIALLFGGFGFDPLIRHFMFISLDAGNLLLSGSLAFGIAGVCYLSCGLYYGVRNARTKRLKQRYLGEPWTWDFLDNELSAHDIAQKYHVLSLFVLLLFQIALTPLTLTAISSTATDDIVIVIGCLSQTVTCICFGVFFLRSSTVLEFGAATLDFQRFPFRLGSKFSVRLKTKERFTQFEQLDVTLCCVQEDIVPLAKGSKIVFRELYAEEIRLLPGTRFNAALPLDIPIIAKLPARPELSTSLQDSAPRYWLLNVRTKTHGTNFSAHFRVPIYA